MSVYVHRKCCFLNPIMWKAATFLAKQNGRSHGKMSLLSPPGSVIKTTLMKSLAEALLYTQMVFLSKQRFGAYTLLRWLVLQTALPGGKRPLCMGSAFLGKYASVTVVDLIQQKKLDFCNLYDEIWKYFLLYRCIRIMTVHNCYINNKKGKSCMGSLTTWCEHEVDIVRGGAQL